MLNTSKFVLLVVTTFVVFAGCYNCSRNYVQLQFDSTSTQTSRRLQLNEEFSERTEDRFLEQYRLQGYSTSGDLKNSIDIFFSDLKRLGVQRSKKQVANSLTRFIDNVQFLKRHFEVLEKEKLEKTVNGIPLPPDTFWIRTGLDKTLDSSRRLMTSIESIPNDFDFDLLRNRIQLMQVSSNVYRDIKVLDDLQSSIDNLSSTLKQFDRGEMLVDFLGLSSFGQDLSEVQFVSLLDSGDDLHNAVTVTFIPMIVEEFVAKMEAISNSNKLTSENLSGALVAGRSLINGLRVLQVLLENSDSNSNVDLDNSSSNNFGSLAAIISKAEFVVNMMDTFLSSLQSVKYLAASIKDLGLSLAYFDEYQYAQAAPFVETVQSAIPEAIPYWRLVGVDQDVTENPFNDFKLNRVLTKEFVRNSLTVNPAQLAQIRNHIAWKDLATDLSMTESQLLNNLNSLSSQYQVLSNYDGNPNQLVMLDFQQYFSSDGQDYPEGGSSVTEGTNSQSDVSDEDSSTNDATDNGDNAADLLDDAVDADGIVLTNIPPIDDYSNGSSSSGGSEAIIIPPSPSDGGPLGGGSSSNKSEIATQIIGAIVGLGGELEQPSGTVSGVPLSGTQGSSTIPSPLHNIGFDPLNVGNTITKRSRFSRIGAPDINENVESGDNTDESSASMMLPAVGNILGNILVQP